MVLRTKSNTNFTNRGQSGSEEIRPVFKSLTKGFAVIVCSSSQLYS